MPVKRARKRRVKRTKTRTATKKKKSALRRRIKYRKSKNWWRKYRGSKMKRSYKNGKLLKYTTKCNISDLMLWLYPNAAKAIAAACVDVKRSDAASFFNNYIRDACNKFCRWMMALDDRSLYGINDGSTTHASKAESYFYAFNPILNRAQCGPFFNQMFNRYNWVKFVGLKVRWKPSQVLSNGVGAYARNNNGEPVGLGPAVGYIPTLPGNVTQINPVTFEVPPRYYFNVIFNKDNYLDIPFYARSLNANYAAILQNDVPDQKYIGPTIMKRVKQFDDWDQTSFRVKKYCLSFPFKFYVRPYEQQMYTECGIFDARYTKNQNEYAIDYMNALVDKDNIAANKDDHYGIPHPATWRRTSLFCPSYLDNKPSYNTAQDDDIMKCTKYIDCLLSDGLYYNPVLFGYQFTADLKERNQATFVSGIAKQQLGHMCSPADLDTGVGFQSYLNISQLGNFYFTVYLRFKGRRYNQVITNENNLKDPLYGSANNPSWY